MVAHGLQRIAEAGLVVTVIDEQRHQWCLRGPRRKRRHQPLRAGTNFEDSPIWCVQRKRCFWKLLGLQRVSLGENESIVSIQRRNAHAKNPAPHQLPDGKGIEKLVGDDDERALRHILDAIVPLDRRRRAAQGLLLHVAQAGTRLDQSDGDGFKEFRHAAPGAQRVGHERAAPRSKLGDRDRFRRAHRLPDGDGPQPEQLAEDLADLGRGDEIALRADRMARGVIARIAGRPGRRPCKSATLIVPSRGDACLEPRGERRRLRARF